MENINKDKIYKEIEATKNLMLRNSPRYGTMLAISGKHSFKDNVHYESLYANATEDMGTYYKEFKSPTSFLSIGASGEQVVNAIATGAKVIDVYDSNALCKHATNLRIAALRGLNKEDFKLYYKTFSPFVFSSFAELLPEDSLYYWVGLYSSFPVEMAGSFIRDFLFTYKRLDESLVELINPYLQGDNYEKVREMAGNVEINYLDCDLYSLPKVIGDKKYDGMTFSNIYEYINYNRNVTMKKAIQYRDFVIKEMYPHLNEDGAMMVSYLYAWNKRLKEEFDKIHKAHPENLVGTGALTLDRYIDYMIGHTTQNLAYSYLMDAFKNDPIKYLPTNHVQYGQSTDMSHDLALILKK